jgi:hypothetical protein
VRDVHQPAVAGERQEADSPTASRVLAASDADWSAHQRRTPEAEQDQRQARRRPGRGCPATTAWVSIADHAASVPTIRGAATTTPSAISSRPRPSRRCSGSRSTPLTRRTPSRRGARPRRALVAPPRSGRPGEGRPTRLRWGCPCGPAGGSGCRRSRAGRSGPLTSGAERARHRAAGEEDGRVAIVSNLRDGSRQAQHSHAPHRRLVPLSLVPSRRSAHQRARECRLRRKPAPRR